MIYRTDLSTKGSVLAFSPLERLPIVALSSKGKRPTRHGGSNWTMASRTTNRREEETRAFKEQISSTIEQALSREMQSLSFKDRVQIQEEIHGVSKQIEETPEQIEEALQLMQHHVTAIHPKSVYDKIPAHSYIHTREFKLRFLRCELYDCRKAADRLIRFTEYMNAEYLRKPFFILNSMRMSDLETKTGAMGKKVMKSFKTGHTQFLPFRDSSGRVVIFSHSKALSFDLELKVCKQYCM